MPRRNRTVFMKDTEKAEGANILKQGRLSLHLIAENYSYPRLGIPGLEFKIFSTKNRHCNQKKKNFEDDIDSERVRYS